MKETVSKMVSSCEEMIANCFGIYHTITLALGGKLSCVYRKKYKRTVINQSKTEMTSLKGRMSPVLSDYTVPWLAPTDTWNVHRTLDLMFTPSTRTHILSGETKALEDWTACVRSNNHLFFILERSPPVNLGQFELFQHSFTILHIVFVNLLILSTLILQHWLHQKHVVFQQIFITCPEIYWVVF